jgi:hypothetical protein
MTAQNANAVVCAFCGEVVPASSAVEMVLVFSGDETQTIYAHAAHLRQHLHPSVPLHPDVLEAAENNPDSK